ncbi:hypothetical protein [Georgenia sp. MJ170]|uniref:hypothetical protein n=1 Tax=Georgenia sunbinii TaxID=3117728 RepID=UPI002F25F61E
MTVATFVTKPGSAAPTMGAHGAAREAILERHTSLGIELESVRASCLPAAGDKSLGHYLHARISGDADFQTVDPDPADVARYATFLERNRAGPAVESAAASAL